MADAWPASLPQFTRKDGYSEAFADNLLRARTDTGPAKVRRRSTAAPRPLSVNMRMTAAELATLSTFVNTTLLGGALPFIFPPPTGGSAVLVRFAEGGLPKWGAQRNGFYSVGFQLEVLP